MPISPSDEEERYFRAAEAEARKNLRAELARNAKALEEHRKIAESVGTEDHTLAERIKELGFDGESAPVFDLLPLVHVAWADGSVQKGERVAILDILKARGILPHSPGWLLMESLLEERPSDAFMHESIVLLREVVGEEGDRTGEIVDLCIKVAAASGGFLGLGHRIGPEERDLIARVSLALGDAAAAKVKKDMA